ncbi:thiamine-phosphate kinase [Myxacorys almedinensis]|uniref:Thiamine-monophosphate kinase n=1 Tax=Myxacorys almedinensis A TaxID=2690445 RepID=A0A8J8CKB8_9CYAN|nr:thiamine-phosphate kinase [Myxacorys almedinensis]NDJ19384.1 thiamine-phosphate kinase [Myxacorys almedinensis A]
MELRVQDIGEQGLLKRVQAFCPSTFASELGEALSVGDDAAVLPTEPGKSLVVTSDVLVDGVHFSDSTTPPESAGWRAAAANLSDLAAMGASPLGITVGLGLPGDVLVSWVERLYVGMTDCLRRYNTVIVGGDICRSPVITVSITALGQVDPTRVIRRSTAQPGDAIVVTGYHGSSRAGLELLLHPEVEPELEGRASLIHAHQYPNPRLDVLPPFPCAGMDSSDGVADAVLQLCQASGVGARLDRQRIPIHPALRNWASPEQAMQWALYGGEDFELVLCLPKESAQELVKQSGEGSAIVGTITSNPEVRVVDSTGEYSDQILTLEEGFQHFKSE